MTTSTVWKAATGALIALTLAPIRVEATITSVTVAAARDYDDPFNLFVFISGTFTRFSDDELLDRYQSRDQYLSRVRRAADHLAASGYITDPDRMALIAAAECEPLPEELPCRK